MGRSKCLFCLIVDLDLEMLVVAKAAFEKSEGGNVTLGVAVGFCSKLSLLVCVLKA